MRKWQSHKIVEAGVMRGFSRGPEDQIILIVDDGERVEVQPNFMARGEPALGDYIVRYEDGYLSWSPKKAFEEDYTEVTL